MSRLIYLICKIIGSISCAFCLPNGRPSTTVFLLLYSQFSVYFLTTLCHHHLCCCCCWCLAKKKCTTLESTHLPLCLTFICCLYLECGWWPSFLRLFFYSDCFGRLASRWCEICRSSLLLRFAKTIWMQRSPESWRGRIFHCINMGAEAYGRISIKSLYFLSVKNMFSLSFPEICVSPEKKLKRNQRERRSLWMHSVISGFKLQRVALLISCVLEEDK